MLKNFFVTAYRNLAKNKVFTFLNVAGLAIGIAVCLIIGIWLQRELSFDKFHPKDAQLFRVSNSFKSESEQFSQAGSGPALGSQLPKEVAAIESSCRVFGDSYKLQYGDKIFIEEKAIDADSNFFNFFGFKLIRGDANDALKTFDRIVLSESLAKKYFGDQDPIGKTIRVDGDFPKTVTGIVENAPANSHIQYDLIMPVSHLRKLNKERYNFDLDQLWVGGWPYTYVRLKNPQQWQAAEKEINVVVAKHSEKEWKENKMSYSYFLQPVRDIHLKSHLRYDAENNGSVARVNIFSIVGIIVLLLACINYINLTTAGAIKRAKETSVRKVVGASKSQLLRQFFVETLLICAIAVAAGVVMFKLILPSFSSWIGQPYQFLMSGTNIAMLAGVVVLISLIAGIYPATILSSFNPAISLKGSFMHSKKGNAIRKGLVVFQFTITITLVSSILIISRQMNYIKSKSLGYKGNAVVEVRFYGEPVVIDKYNSLRNQLLANPHVLNVSKHNQNVVGGLGNGWTTTENLKGEEISTSLYNLYVDTSFLDTYQMKLVAGRFFSKDMPTDTTKSVLVNEAAVRTFGWQKPENAIGKRFGKGDNMQHVIGVVKDFNFESLHKPVEALLIGYSMRGNRLSVKIDAAHIDDAIEHLKKVWSKTIPEVPLQYAFVDETLDKQYGNEQKMEGIFYGFSGLSLLIACLGLFGLSIFVVERKLKEISIRKVLGANVSGLVGLISKDFLKLVLVAAVIATPLAWYFMNAWLQDFAYRVNIGWWIFALSGIIAFLIALITISFKAISAAVANPVKSLRTE